MKGYGLYGRSSNLGSMNVFSFLERLDRLWAPTFCYPKGNRVKHPEHEANHSNSSGIYSNNGDVLPIPYLSSWQNCLIDLLVQSSRRHL
jgi:hypothetical protein